MWYTMTVTHVPRAEEWPVMSAARAGFSLVPSGFFTRNPALDVPRTPAPVVRVPATTK
jgi:primary-amine oxidase